MGCLRDARQIVSGGFRSVCVRDARRIDMRRTRIHSSGRVDRLGNFLRVAPARMAAAVCTAMQPSHPTVTAIARTKSSFILASESKSCLQHPQAFDSPLLCRGAGDFAHTGEILLLIFVPI
jgi:hypothetical protein